MANKKRDHRDKITYYINDTPYAEGEDPNSSCGFFAAIVATILVLVIFFILAFIDS